MAKRLSLQRLIIKLVAVKLDKVVNQFNCLNTHIHEFPTSQETMLHRHTMYDSTRLADSLWHCLESLISLPTPDKLYKALTRHSKADWSPQCQHVSDTYER